MNPQPAQNTSRIPCLDGIRALAALMVMCFHFIRPGMFPASVVKLGLVGQTGVDLFFVLSGFLITRLLLDSRDAAAPFSRKIGVFYSRRSLRIFPLYFGYLALHFFVLPVLEGTPISPWRHQIWAWTYSQTLPATFPDMGASSGPGHFWSLSIEEHFYLFWPFLALLCSHKNFLRACVFIILASPLIRHFLYASGYEVYYFTGARLDSLAYGGLAAAFVHAGHTQRLVAFARLAAPLAIGAMILAFLLFSGKQLVWIQALKLSAVPLFYAMAIILCAFDPSRPAAALRTFLSARILGWIGLVSYGLYVFHPLAFHLTEKHAGAWPVLAHMAAAFALTFVMAWASYRLFEAPFLRLKKFFPHTGSTPAAAG